jgi:hypothetical protein
MQKMKGFLENATFGPAHASNGQKGKKKHKNEAGKARRSITGRKMDKVRAQGCADRRKDGETKQKEAF